MKHYFKYSILCLILLGCGIKRTKENHEGTNELQKGLYEELYVSRGGVWADNTYYIYITDSTNFRKYIGMSDDDGGFQINASNDQIKVSKYSWEYNKSNKNKEKHYIDSTLYSVNKLKKEARFD